jgi:hypothetical protein
MGEGALKVSVRRVCQGRWRPRSGGIDGGLEIVMRALVWVHILIILGLIGYSTYSLFKGDFEQALLTYPILILYYLVFAKRSINSPSSSSEGDDGSVGE